MKHRTRPLLAALVLTISLLFGVAATPAAAGSTTVSSNGCTAYATVFNSGGRAYIKVSGSNSYYCRAVQGTLYYRTYSGDHRVAGPYYDYSKPHYIITSRYGYEKYGRVCVLPLYGGWVCKYFG